MAAAVPRDTTYENDCTTCRNVMKHCYCSYCDDAALVDGMQFGYSISYKVGRSTSRIGMYMGSIKAESMYPCNRDSLTFSERSQTYSNETTGGMVTAATNGVFVLESDDHTYSIRRPLFVPGSDLCRALSPTSVEPVATDGSAFENEIAAVH